MIKCIFLTYTYDLEPSDRAVTRVCRGTANPNGNEAHVHGPRCTEVGTLITV